MLEVSFFQIQTVRKLNFIWQLIYEWKYCKYIIFLINGIFHTIQSNKYFHPNLEFSRSHKNISNDFIASETLKMDEEISTDK